MMIFYPKCLFAAGFAPLPNVLFIRADCKGNVPLFKHEQVHQRQMLEDGIIVFWARYLFSRKWRLHYEVEAYRTQIFAGAAKEGCAANLSTLYYLDLTYAQALQLL